MDSGAERLGRGYERERVDSGAACLARSYERERVVLGLSALDVATSASEWNPGLRALRVAASASEWFWIQVERRAHEDMYDLLLVSSPAVSLSPGWLWRLEGLLLGDHVARHGIKIVELLLCGEVDDQRT